MIAKLPNLIASEDLQSCDAWSLPEVGKGVKTLSAESKKRQLEAEKQARIELARAKASQTPEAAAHAEGEVIEDVDDDSLSYSPLTADQLQEMADAAEKEGFDLGYGEGVVKGIAEGKKQGYEEGMAQAQAEVRETLTTQVSQLLQVAEALVEPIQGQEDQLQKLMLRYVTALTEQVVERELLQDSSHILSVVQRAMQALPVGAEKIKVILNPDDLALVETYAQEQEKPWLFRGDSQLQPGGCRIESAESLIDFSVESRMKAMFSQFLDKQLVGSEDEWDQAEQDETEHETEREQAELSSAEFQPEQQPDQNSDALFQEPSPAPYEQPVPYEPISNDPVSNDPVSNDQESNGQGPETSF